MKCCDTRYEYEIHVKTELIAHKVMGCTCPLSGEKLQGDFPAGITGSKQYGAGVFALVNTLLTVGYVVLPAQMAFFRQVRTLPLSASPETQFGAS